MAQPENGIVGIVIRGETPANHQPRDLDLYLEEDGKVYVGLRVPNNDESAWAVLVSPKDLREALDRLVPKVGGTP